MAKSNKATSEDLNTENLEQGAEKTELKDSFTGTDGAITPDKKDEAPIIDESKLGPKKDKIPDVELPKTSEVVTEKVRFTEDIKNLYFCGIRITAKKGEIRSFNKTICNLLREKEKAV